MICPLASDLILHAWMCCNSCTETSVPLSRNLTVPSRGSPTPLPAAPLLSHMGHRGRGIDTRQQPQGWAPNGMGEGRRETGEHES